MSASISNLPEATNRLTDSGVSHPLRVGIVGAGKMAVNHATAAQRAGRHAAVVAVADPSAAARQRLVAAVPGAAEFSSLGDMLEQVKVDVLHVCTPPDTHYTLALQALGAGAHVYVEKPFTAGVSQAAEVLDLAARCGLLVCAGHQLLFEPPTRVALNLLPALGQLSHVESYFSFRTVRRTPGGRAPLRADLQLLDILPHPVYLLLQFLGAGGGGIPELVALEVGERGTVHGLVRAGRTTGALVVTLEGRPIENYIRLVGTNGSVFADYVRSTVQQQVGPGTSGIDKALAPYRQAGQLLTGTTRALARRVATRQRSYPGLSEIFEAFYQAIEDGSASPTPPESILATTEIWERVRDALRQGVSRRADLSRVVGGTVVITGGTGLLGRAVVKRLRAGGKNVRVIARREPAEWERVEGAEYVVGDLGEPISPTLLQDAKVIIHAAAETAGSWEEHQRNSLGATENLLRGAAAAGVKQVIHVSSLAVLAPPGRGARSDEATPLRAQPRASGPYVWGKLESERLARQLEADLGLNVKIIRPGALVDYDDFDPPGRLGKRLGNVFVAVGSPGDQLGIADVGFSAEVLSWMTDHFEEAPTTLNLISPDLPPKRALISRLKGRNPGLRVVWLPWAVLIPLAWLAVLGQKMLRPKAPAMNLHRVFGVTRYATLGITAVVQQMQAEQC